MSEFSVSHECEPFGPRPTEVELAAAAQLLDPKQNLQWDLDGELQGSIDAATRELDAIQPNRYQGGQELGLAGFEPLSGGDSLQPGAYVMQRVEPEIMRTMMHPESMPTPLTKIDAAEVEKMPRLNDEQVDRVLLPIIRKIFSDGSADARKIAIIADRHREAARELMENHDISAGEVVVWLEVAIRGGERDASGRQPVAKAEKRPSEDPVTSAQAARFTELAGLTDRQQRDLGVTSLITEMAAAELKTAVTDPDVREIAERLKPLLDNSLKLFPKAPVTSIKNLQGAIRSSVEQVRRRRVEATAGADTMNG